MTTAKNEFLLGYNLKIVTSLGKLTFGGGRGSKNLVMR